MNKKRSKTTRVTAEQARKLRSRTDWKRVDRLTDADIRRATTSDPDARLTDRAFWKGARLVRRESES
jgi:hypothetical protein